MRARRRRSVREAEAARRRARWAPGPARGEQGRARGAGRSGAVARSAFEREWLESPARTAWIARRLPFFATRPRGKVRRAPLAGPELDIPPRRPPRRRAPSIARAGHAAPAPERPGRRVRRSGP